MPSELHLFFSALVSSLLALFLVQTFFPWWLLFTELQDLQKERASLPNSISKSFKAESHWPGLKSHNHP